MNWYDVFVGNTVGVRLKDGTVEVGYCVAISKVVEGGRLEGFMLDLAESLSSKSLARTFYSIGDISRITATAERSEQPNGKKTARTTGQKRTHEAVIPANQVEEHQTGQKKDIPARQEGFQPTGEHVAPPEVNELLEQPFQRQVCAEVAVIDVPQKKGKNKLSDNSEQASIPVTVLGIATSANQSDEPHTEQAKKVAPVQQVEFSFEGEQDTLQPLDKILSGPSLGQTSGKVEYVDTPKKKVKRGTPANNLDGLTGGGNYPGRPNIPEAPKDAKPIASPEQKDKSKAKPLVSAQEVFPVI